MALPIKYTEAAILIEQNKKIEGYETSNYKELIGINTPLDLKEIENIING